VHAFRIVQLGLSSEPATVTFDFHPHFSIWSTSDPEFDKAREERLLRDMPHITRQVKWLPAFIGVPLGRWLIGSVLNRVEKVKAELTTLSHMIAQLNVERIDLLKIDVEGAELAVLQVRVLRDGFDVCVWVCVCVCVCIYRCCFGCVRALRMRIGPRSNKWCWKQRISPQ